MPAPLTHLPKITRWIKGLVTQRNPIDTPFSIVGQNVVAHNDSLIDGENIEVSSNNTLMRRWGLTQWTNVSIQASLANAADGFWTFRNLNGFLRTMLSTTHGVFEITPTTVGIAFGAGDALQPWSLATSGDYLYGMNGNPANRPFRYQPDHIVSGQSIFQMGIYPPTIPPNLFSRGMTTNRYTSLFIPNADIVSGVFFVNQPDLGIQFTASVTGTDLEIDWVYTKFPVGPGPITNTTSTTPGGTTATVAENAELGQANVQIKVTGITPTVQGIATALSNNTNLVVGTWGTPEVFFDSVLGNINPQGSVFQTANGAAFRIQLSQQSDEPQMGFADITQTNYSLQLSPGTIPIISYFQLPFVTLTDVLTGSVTISDRVDNGGFTTHIIAVPAFPNNNVQGLANAIQAALPAAVVNLYKTGTTAQLLVLAALPGTEQPSNHTWTITANSIQNLTTFGFLTWNVVDTNTSRVKPINQIQLGFVWRNESTGHVSTMSPASPQYFSKSHGTWLEVSIDLANTTDPQVTHPELYATADGGSSFLFTPQFYTIVGTVYTFYYFTGDDQLNPQIVAPLNLANNPPPVGGFGLVTHTQRKWCIVDNLVYYSGGPDTTNGLGDEAWPPANNFAFPGPVTKIQPTNNGLMVFLKDDLHLIEGVDASSYFAHPFAVNMGISYARAEFYDGQTMFIYTTSRQLHAVSPGNQDEIGYDINDQLQQFFDPTKTSVVVHRGPSTDFALFISNGVDKIFRYAPGKGWSPVGQYDTTGLGAIGSIETSPGVIQLLVSGPQVGPSESLKVYFRDYTSYQDAGVPYTGFVTVGGIALSDDPGVLVPVNNIVLQMTAAGSDPSVSILLNELTGTFQQLSAKDGPIFDPPTARPPSTTLRQKRWWSQDSLEPIIERANTLFVRIDFPAENAKSEVLSLFARSND